MTDFTYDLMVEDTVDFSSEAISIVAFNRESNELYVEFHSGGEYAYQGVAESTYNMFVLSDSLGRFYQNNISGEFDRTEYDPAGLVERETDDEGDIEYAIAPSVINIESGTKPNFRFSVEWVDLDNVALSGAPQFHATDETDALTQFYDAMNTAQAVGFSPKVVKVKSLTRYFD